MERATGLEPATYRSGSCASLFNISVLDSTRHKKSTEMTMRDIVNKTGAGVRAIADAEKGKPSTSAVVCVAMLWAVDLLPQLNTVALPENDSEGQALALAREPSRARTRTGGLDNDF
jgi:hypothetical protein